MSRVCFMCNTLQVVIRETVVTSTNIQWLNQYTIIHMNYFGFYFVDSIENVFIST